MWGYNIIKTEMGWIISRTKEVGKIKLLQYLGASRRRITNKTYAKIFYKQDDASGALAIMKIIGAKEAS